MEGRYRKNAGAVCSFKYHLVWCPRYRRSVLEGETATRLRYLLIEKAAELDLDVRAMEVMPDHAHLFIESDPTRAVAEIVNRLKGYTPENCGNSSRHSERALRPCGPGLTTTVGHVSDIVVSKYIENQKGK
jgi:putative transposase